MKRMVTYFDCVRLDGNVCVDCDIFGRCVGVRDYKGFMGEQMMFNVDKAIKLSVKNVQKRFEKKIKETCKRGEFSAIFEYSSQNELIMYEILIKNMGYKCNKDRYGYVEVMW